MLTAIFKKINDFFDFQVTISLTWEGAGNNLNDKMIRATPSIVAKSEIEIGLDPPGPFAFVPRQILEAVGNRAIGITLGTLQSNFMKSLGKDFERWASDEDYRAQRRALEFNLTSENESSDKMDETLMAYLRN